MLDAVRADAALPDAAGGQPPACNPAAIMLAAGWSRRPSERAAGGRLSADRALLRPGELRAVGQAGRGQDREHRPWAAGGGQQDLHAGVPDPGQLRRRPGRDGGCIGQQRPDERLAVIAAVILVSVRVR